SPPDELFPPAEPLPIVSPRFPPMAIPEDNPTSVQGVELGRRLFYDPILSGDGTQSCASCHAQPFAFSDHGQRFSRGIDGSIGTRNAPALVNVGWNLHNFWDGRVETLEEQALEPVVNPIEMNNTWENVVESLRRHPDYPRLFGHAFGSSEITAQRVVQAIAQFERTFVSDDSKYDRFLRGAALLSSAEQRGLELFFTETGDCFHCHDERLFSVGDFRDIGLDSIPPDPGRGDASADPNDVGRFKIPTLRNVELTAPYMHDGRFATLEEVLEHYNSGGVHSRNVDPLIRVGRGLGLTPEQKQDLIAFLKTLTDTSFVRNPQLANPFE
ncbi:MAG: cytochrome-c peroxidase, partial [Candidatus Latescibacterota bacterium]